MEFPPPAWDVFDSSEFDNAVPRNPGELGAELMVQARATGRLLDHFRLAIGGNKLLRISLQIGVVFPAASLPEWNLDMATWPKDIKMRRNMTTSPWYDLTDMLQANEVNLLDQDKKEVVNADLLGLLARPTDGCATTSIRWAAVVGDDHNLELQLQALPAAATQFDGKPVLKG